MTNKKSDLNEYLNSIGIDDEIKKIVKVLSSTCYEISQAIRESGKNNLIGKTGEINIQGEHVEKLDEFANNLLVSNLSKTGNVFAMGSEENETIISVKTNNQEAKYIVVFDPLDGSSNIDVAVTIGTIFAIYKKVNSDETDKANLLQKGKNIILAGYTVYGSSTVMCLSKKSNTSMFSFDNNGLEILTNEHINHGNSKVYSVNESNWNKFTDKDKRWISKLKSGDLGKYTSRYVGSLVADFHRNLLKGGVFAYPVDSTTGIGRLRLIYECNPLAFIAQNTQGNATDGNEKILDIQPLDLHQRVGLYIGNNKEIEIYKNS
ncbi:MAG: fructose-1,6-bisphosphatase [Dehalococcoidia bacterium]|nr:fructose-1,6-bisphosphatase [Dehalococcoidia bacterium]